LPRSVLAACLAVAAGVFASATAQPAGPTARAGPSQPEPAEAGADETPAAPPVPVALLQGLDKVTARVSTFEAPLNEIVRFGTLEIIAWACHKRPPEEPPESAAFLQIRDAKPGEPPTDLFMGWMFASSPALSALEHPVYDIWVLDCKNAKNSASSSSE
jgi:hypothetical protein